MTRARSRAIAFGLSGLAAAALAAFIPAPALAQWGLDKVIKAAETQRPWSASEEKAIGEASAAKLVAIFGLYEEPGAVKYVNLVGNAVSQYAGRRDLDYHFGILDTEIVNAFATPGGYIFVTRGLLANLESEAELAGVLGHEITHASERHIEKELRSRKLAAIGVEEGASYIPVSELAHLADRTVNLLLAGKLSRDKENEADSGGVELAAAVGYDPRAYVEFLGVLDQASPEAGNRRALGNLTASHPKFSDRVKRLEDIITKRGWDKEERARLPERYEANMKFPSGAAGSAEAPAPAAAETASAPGAGAPAPAAASSVTAAAAPAEREAARPAASAATGAPPASGAGSPAILTFRPFSADQITTQGGKRQTAKVYMTQNAVRLEGEERGQKSIAIMRWDRKVIWSLMPAQQMYAEMPLNWGQDISRLAQDPKAQVERELLGPESLGPYHCLKYRVRVTYEGQTQTYLEWTAQELEGLAVKRVDEKTGTIVEYENINLSPPDPALFEVPPGYRKLSF